ncbi:MAG: hypothetical protein ABJP45_04155 [Cyclobacteriaceae bacterium]
MRSTIKCCFLRLLVSIFFLHTLTFGYSQGLMPENLEKISLSRTKILEPLKSEYKTKLFVKAWSDHEQGPLGKSFGLRHKPDDDQNVYLLCNYQIGNSRAEVGLSLNNFTAMTITFGHRLSLRN